MYAIVSTGGKQLKVENGTVIVVEKLDAEPGSVVDLEVVFLADGDEIVVDAAKLAAATVKAEVIEHFKADKVIVFKFKKRKGYKRTKGHRQLQTRLKVSDILAVGGDAKKAAKAKPAKAEAAEATPAKPAAKKAPARKPAAAKAPAKPKTATAAQADAGEAAEKPAAKKAPAAAKPAAKKAPAAAKPAAKKAPAAAKPAAKKAPAKPKADDAATDAVAEDKPKRTTRKKAEPAE